MLPDRASLIRYARQKLRYAAGGQNLSRLTHGYFVSHSPRIWRPLGINIHSEEDPETNEPISVAYVSGILNSVRPDMRAGGIYGSNSHGGTFQRTTHILAPGAEVDDAHFQHSPQADRDTDLHEDEVHRYVAGQRAVREFVGLNPKQTAYMTPILTSQELANEAARATGGFVHEVQLNPRQFAGNNVTVLNARNGHAALSNSYGLQGALNDSETHLDISRQVHLANTYAGHTRADQTSGNAQALKHLHLINQRHWPMLTQHHDALMTLPGAPHPHQALLGRTLRDHTNLLAPSHEALLSAGEPASTIYQMALKHPEEPVHRMALADSLDEQGHSGAADFFRSTLPNAEPPPQKLSRRGSIVSYARSRLSSASSSSSLPGHVVAYVAQRLQRYARQPAEALPHEHPDQHAQAGASRLEQTDWADDSGSTVLGPVRKHMANIMGHPVSDADMADILRIPRPYKNAPDHPALHPSNFIVDISPSHPFDGNPSLAVRVKSNLPNYGFHTETRISRYHNGVQITNHSQGHDGIEGEPKAISTPHILWNQAFAAHRNGVKSLLTSAELRRERINGLGGSTGGLVWPKYGYDAHLKHISPWRAFEHVPEELRVAMANKWPKKSFNSLTLQDLLDTPEGHKWYFHQEDRMQTMPKYLGGGTFPGVYNPNAFQGDMFFHTHPGKRSMAKALVAAKNIELKNGGASNANA